VDELQVVCVKWGDKYGPEYVNILQDMVWRNLTTPHRFICYTDNHEGISDRVDVRMLPGGLDGWYNKLWLFSPDAGLSGRVLYFDLDTAITGRLEEIAEYSGPLCMLDDFYGWTKYGSGVMAWNSSVYPVTEAIWKEYKDSGLPAHPKGDQGFICDTLDWLHLQPATWQGKFPGSFCSYKIHAQKWPPNGCKVVCFHGEPNPHQLPSEWITHVWKLGGISEAKLESKCNTEKSEAISNVRANMARGVQHLQPREGNGKTMVIIGGSPSIGRSMPMIRKAMRKGDIWSVNGTHDFLLERGVTPDYFALLDARKDNARFVQKPNKRTKYLIASHCAPDVFDALKSFDVEMWHAYEPDLHEVFKELAGDQAPIRMLGGGNTVVLKLLYMGRMLGYTKFELFGVDSSYEDDEHHAYPQPMNDGEHRLAVWAAGRKFSCAPWMIVQAKDFQEQVRVLIDEGCIVTVHGNGLIPFIASQLAQGEDSNAE